jgi:hypothetical protein
MAAYAEGCVCLREESLEWGCAESDKIIPYLKKRRPPTSLKAVTDLSVRRPLVFDQSQHISGIRRELKADVVHQIAHQVEP